MVPRSLREGVMGGISTGYYRNGALALLIVLGLCGGLRAGQVITDDRGGALEPRYALIADLRARGEHVAIGGICYSACTLYLGLETVCVTPDARLGFHGPSSNLPGLPLPHADFERQSQRMASHYPPAIHHWFLREARYVTRSLYVLDGAQLVAMGARACQTH